MIPPTGISFPRRRKSNHVHLRRGSQDSNLESPVLETGAFVHLATAPRGDRSGVPDSQTRVIRPSRDRTCVRMRVRPQVDYESALTLIEAGYGDTDIARMTGIPRGTVSSWRHGLGTAYHRRLA